MPAISGSSSPWARGLAARCALALARRSSFSLRFSARALSLARFSSVGLVRFATRTSCGHEYFITPAGHALAGSVRHAPPGTRTRVLSSGRVTISASSPSADCQRFFESTRPFGIPLAVKLYRIHLDPPLPVPTLPCLDHEAMLHEGIAPHAAAYLRDAAGDLHELVYVPGERRIDIETVSTMGECSADGHQRFVAAVRGAFPALRVRVVGPSWLRGDRRVAHACRAQVTLRDVLADPDLDRTKVAIERLRTISSLMEKESRVASWGARTVMTPLLAVAGFITYQVLGTLGGQLGAPGISVVRYLVVGVIGAFFLYYGLKAVHLTQMANRVWKRSAEYGLIVAERDRLRAAARERETAPGTRR